MALADNLATEKQKLTSLLESEYQAQSFRDNVLLRLLIVRFLLGELVGSGGSGGTGDASAINQTSVQSLIGAIPSKVLGIQGVVGGVSVPVVANAGANLNTSALATESGGNLAGINNKLPSSLGAKTAVNSVSFVPATDAIFTVSQAPVVPAFLFASFIVRANNVTPYAVNTVYGGTLQFSSQSAVAAAGQWLIITDIEIVFNIAVLPVGMAGFQLYTYGVTPPSNVLDTGAFSLPAGDRASIIYPNGLSLGNAALARGGGSVTVQMNNINVPIQLSGASSFFAYLVSIGAFTPAAALETATIRVRAIAL